MTFVSKSVAHLVRALAWAISTALPVQLFFAGAFIFGALPVVYHQALGMFIVLAALLTALLSLTTRMTRENAKNHWVLVGFLVVQVLLVWLRPKFPAISALHVPNTGFLIVWAKKALMNAKVPASVAGRRPSIEIQATPA